MANYTTLAKGGNDIVGATGTQSVQVVPIELDMADVLATSGFSTGDNFTALHLPDYTYFQFLGAECVSELVGITQIDIGDEDDDDQFVAAATVVTAGTDLTVVTADHTDGKVTLGASELRVKVTGAPSTGVLRLYVLAAPCTRNAAAVPKVYPVA